MNYEETGWKSRAKLIRHLRWEIRNARLTAWVVGSALPAGAEASARVADKFGDWVDPSRSKTKPHTPREYKIEKSLHRDSAELRRDAEQCRRKAAEWRDAAAPYHHRVAELENQIAELLSGEDWS